MDLEIVILQVLKTIFDPEIPVNLVDLGLIYDVLIDKDQVDIKMTLTAAGCPMAASISNSVKSTIEAIEGVTSTNVEIVWEPPWSPEKISPDGRIALGMA